MKDLQGVLTTLRYIDRRQMPPEWKIALETAIRLEQKTQKSKASFIAKWEERLGKERKSAPPQSIRFGDVKVYNQQVKLETTRPPSDKIGRDITSKTIVEKYILGLLQCAAWSKYCCGTPASLRAEIIKNNLTKQQLIIDLYRIYKYINHDRVAILGYNNSWKLYPVFKVTKWNYRTNRWEETGKTRRLAPLLKRYMIRIVQEPEMAATTIQAQWRKKRAQTLYQISREFQNKLKLIIIAFQYFTNYGFFTLTHGSGVASTCIAGPKTPRTRLSL